MKKILKQLAAQLHLWLGIISGLVVFIVALTGSILVFEEELEPVVYASFHKVENTGQKALSLDHLAALVHREYPKNNINRINVEPDPERTVVFGLKQAKGKEGLLAVAVNPYTGTLVGEHEEYYTFFPVVTRLHRYLCMGETGKAITGVSCVCFLVIMITGLVMWWPNRKNRRQRLTIKWGASFKRLNWDLHAVVGFYVLPFIFLIALTGLVWSYKWVNNLIYLAFDGKPPQKREAPANVSLTPSADTYFQKLLTETNALLPHPGAVNFTVPDKDSVAITVSKRDEAAPIANVVSFLYFDKHDGKLISTRLYKDETPGFKARRVVFPVHTGSLLGWPTKLIAFLAALAAATLPVTGIIIWLGKKTKKKSKKTKRVASRKKEMAPPGVVAFSGPRKA